MTDSHPILGFVLYIGLVLLLVVTWMGFLFVVESFLLRKELFERMSANCWARFCGGVDEEAAWGREESFPNPLPKSHPLENLAGVGDTLGKGKESMFLDGKRLDEKRMDYRHLPQPPKEYLI